MKYILLIVFPLLLISGACNKDESCSNTNCADYSTQAAAQTDFDSDRDCHSDLDSDNDGIACEHLPNSTSCPTTAKCGCSGHNKTECDGDPCCKWTTGQGCGCK
tara:strand:+ start:1358 stop:1669 length:312 start_codon:yes stop_codon:yes gene_type:complete